MDHPLRRPDEILAYRSLKQILAAKSQALWTVGPGDKVLTAVRLMAEKNIGFIVVIERGVIVGVLPNAIVCGDWCWREIPEATAVADIMVRDVIEADLAHTFADCLRLMHTHRIRHLPMVEMAPR